MKLFSRYSRINLIATLIIFFVAIAAFYFTLNYILIGQIDDDLKIEEEEINTYIKAHDQLPENLTVKDQVINYFPIDKPFAKRYFTRSMVVDEGEKEQEAFRQLIFGIEAGGKYYKVVVGKSLEDMDSMRRSVLLISIMLVFLILIVSLVINRVLLKRIWKPFYLSLDFVKDFKVSEGKNLQLPAAKVEEFNFMNRTLERITNQARLDYLSLKTFSENASHEIQTPIAIIRSKLDLLIQDENLTEQQSEAVQSAYNSIEKLTKLNRSLLLLAKIENNQFAAVQEMDLKKKMEEKLNEFHELFESHQVSLQCNLKNAVVNMNADLTDILLNNLVSNATKHNYAGGTISIELDENHLSFRNTSHEQGLDQEKIFQRFYKPSQNNEHNGLGLSIIKQICNASGIQLSYSFQQGLHDFVLNFNNNKKNLRN